MRRMKIRQAVETLSTKSSKYAVKKSNKGVSPSNNAKPKNTEKTFVRSTSNKHETVYQPQIMDSPDITICDENKISDSIVGNNSENSEGLYLMRQNTGLNRKTIKNAMNESDNVTSHSILNEKLENIEHTYEPYITRKNNLNLQKLTEFWNFKERYDSLLDKDHALKREIDSKINSNERKNKKQQENLYKKWSKNVYNPLISKLQESIQSLPWSLIQSKKHEIYKRYLQYINTKGCAYLDIVDPEEYSIYPYSYKVPEKVDMNIPHDPLQYSTQLYDEELKISLCLLTGKNYSRNDIEKLKLFSRPIYSTSRENTDAAKWLLMSETNILSTPRIASRRKIHPGRFNKSMLSEYNKTKI